MSAHRYLTLVEAAERLQVAQRTLRRRVASGLLPAFRDGRIVRIREVDLDSYVAANITRSALNRRGVRTSGVVLPPEARLWDS